MRSFWKRAGENMVASPFLTVTTLFTITLCVLIASFFLLLFENTGGIMGAELQGVRVLAYLDEDFRPDDFPQLEKEIQALEQIVSVVFVSRKKPCPDWLRNWKTAGWCCRNCRPIPFPIPLKLSLPLQRPVWIAWKRWWRPWNRCLPLGRWCMDSAG